MAEHSLSDVDCVRSGREFLIQLKFVRTNGARLVWPFSDVGEGKGGVAGLVMFRDGEGFAWSRWLCV